MEDFQLDIVIGKGPSARSIRLDLPALHARRRHHPHRPDHRPAPRPLRLRRPARLLRARRPRGDPRARRRHPRRPARADGGAHEIAGRARGTPRIANRLLKRVRDYAEVRGDGTVDRRHRPGRARAVRGRRARPRQGRPRDPRARCARRSRGQPVGLAHARGRGGRGARHRRGRLRAVPAEAGPARCARPGAGSPPPAAYAHLGRSRRAPESGRTNLFDATARPDRGDPALRIVLRAASADRRAALRLHGHRRHLPRRLLVAGVLLPRSCGRSAGSMAAHRRSSRARGR